MFWLLGLAIYLAAWGCLIYAAVHAPLMEEGKRGINEKNR